MTRMTDEAERRREAVENALASLAVMRVEIRLARVRVEQAVERWPAAHYLLRPVAVYLARWEQAIGKISDLLRQHWLAGNKNGWSEEE
jgi:hypothetical protein